MHQHISNFVSDSVAQADFGLATINGAGGGQHTAAAGTLRYMAPEVMQSTSYGFKADVFSFGKPQARLNQRWCQRWYCQLQLQLLVPPIDTNGGSVRAETFCSNSKLFTNRWYNLTERPTTHLPTSGHNLVL